MEQDYRTSSFIWIDQWEQVKKNEPCVVYFRKTFEKAERIRISANCRYKLYINGVFLQEGPQKGSAEAAYADEAEIGPFLQEGRNTAAVEVLYYPEDPEKRNDSLYYSPYPCLYVADQGGGLDARSGWKCCLEEGIRLVKEPFDPAPICGAEISAGNAALKGWMSAAYDDSWWQEAKPYTFFEANRPSAPFLLEPRTIPPMAHEKKSFREVVCVRESCAQTKKSLAEQWNRMISGGGTVEISANTTQIVELSAGEEMCGYPSLVLAGGKDAEIEILYAEAYGLPQPDVETPMGKRHVPPKKGDRTDFVNGCLCGFSDIFRPAGYGTREEPEVYTPYLFRTFRFVQVRVTTKDQGISILRYDYLSTGYPLEVRTRLETSDESMNRIWDISLRTLKRCMHETYVDCPFYEQLQYTMDSRAEMLFTYAVSGDDRLARQCMEAFRRTQRSDGILQASAPAVGVNVIPGFSIFYILMLHDHMMYFGDKALIREHFGCMDRILEYFRSHMTEKGLVGSVGGVLFQHRYWSFIDWCGEWNDTIGVPAAALQGDRSVTMESLLYLYGLTAAADLAEYIGREGTASEYRERAKALAGAVRAFCTGTDGLIQDGPGLDLYSTHCQVWAVLTDLVSGEQGRKNLERTFQAEGIPQCSVSMSFYLLLALKKCGMLEKADRLWDQWRKMLDNHLTTCVENATDERSDCHAWGALILYALPAVYLGIRPTSPGFAEYEMKPELGHLKWIRGEVYTPAGMLRIDTAGKEEKEAEEKTAAAGDDVPAEERKEGRMMEKIVKTRYGAVEGFEEDGLIKFLGIPYAKQPRGELRWKRAQECEPWEGVLQAKAYGDVAFQDDHDMEQGSDDCLTVNVVRPAEGEKLPVFVWIHGGGYMCGSCSDTLYHGDAFARDGILYVNFQYRLNVIGFYDFSTYPGCEGIESNRGLSDMIMGLKWVHENIEAFGGDPERVTIGGESAGGAAVVTLMAVPAVRGYFQQVISESGLCNCVMTPEMQRKNVDLFLEGMGWNEEGLYEKLMSADPFEMIRAARYQERVHQYRYPGIFEPGPVIDDLLPERPLDAIREGCAPGVKLLIGTNLHEGTMFVRPENTGFPNSWEMVRDMFEKNGNLEGYEAVKAYYDDPAKEEKYGNPFVHFATDYVWEMPSIKAAAFQSAFADTWMYRFDFISVSAKESGMLASHAFELPCVFDVKEHEFSSFFFKGESSEAADTLIRDIHEPWVRFIRDGEPDPEEWPAFRGEVPPVRIFDRETRTENLDRRELLSVWGDMRFYED